MKIAGEEIVHSCRGDNSIGAFKDPFSKGRKMNNRICLNTEIFFFLRNFVYFLSLCANNQKFDFSSLNLKNNRRFNL